MNAMIAFNALWASRPGRDATPEQEAAWYLAKGRTFEGLAGQARTTKEQATDMDIAVRSFEHARDLLRMKVGGAS